MVPVTGLMSMLIKHVGGEGGIRVSVRMRCQATVVCGDAGIRTSRPRNLVTACSCPKFSLP